MEVKLRTPTDFIKTMEHNAAYAMLICHANTEKLENRKPKTFIQKAIEKEHESILEHITLTYEVNDLSRACLQELARHRHISLSVESTRHTLKEKINKEEWITKYLNTLDDNQQKVALVFLDCAWKLDLPNDELKYFLPEFWTTNLVMTTNIRELRHIVKLRTAPAALYEFQTLTRLFVEVLPDEFKYLLEDCVYKKEEDTVGL